MEHSGFLEKLIPNTAVMAHWGFTNIEYLLIQRRCVLVRPPSVATGAKSTKEEVTETKRIASLRIYVERVIRRLREYKMLIPHSCINSNLISYLDIIVTIVCGERL